MSAKILTVSLHRVTQFINILIAVALVVVLGAVYWFAYRPLPKTSGTIVAGVKAPVRIARDALGVPHIEAQSVEDAVFAQGFVTAQERMWQMDALRRRASGELAEVFGGASQILELDREMRLLRMRRTAEERGRHLPAAEKALMAAYARGVNHYIETHLSKLPVEFSILRYDPRPWTVTDSLLIGLLMNRDLTTTWKDDLLREAMVENGDRAKVLELYPSRTGSDVQPGSNAWAVAGRLTASGKPILANDPHLEYQVPSVWFQTHIKAPGLNVTGVTLPGIPLIIIGHNDRIAWGVTNLHFDVQDVYVEGLQEPVRMEREIIAVKDGRPIEVATGITRHGAVIDTQGNHRLAMRWAAGEAAGYRFPLLALNQASNFGQFTAALSNWRDAAQNFVYADVDGNIGYQATGLLPIRRGYDGRLPVSGDEWTGFIPFEELPRIYNPPSGMIVTANQNPFPEKYAYEVSGNFAPVYRAVQIRRMLERHGGWKPDDMLRVQTDVYSDFSRKLGLAVVAAYEKRKANNPSLTDAVDLLKKWDGQVVREKPEPFLIALIYQHIRKAMGEKAAPGKGLSYTSQMATAVMEQMLRDRPKDWFADWDAMLLRALVDAVEEGRRMQGEDVRKWREGEYLQVTLAHPVVSRIPYIGSWFRIGPVGMNGSSTTVKQTSQRLGPSMRMVVDMGNLDGSKQNLLLGQSGHVLSSHFKDQWEPYFYGRSFPMQFSKIDAKDLLELTPQ